VTKRSARDGRSRIRLIESEYAPVAQLDSVLGYEPDVREFDESPSAIFEQRARQRVLARRTTDKSQGRDE